MNVLRIHKLKLAKVIEIIPEKGHGDLLLLENLLATVWSYRKTKEGMYYSNEQLAKEFYKSERTIKRHMKILRESGLLDTKRRYNSSTTVKPSEKFTKLMGESPKQKGHRDPSSSATVACYTSSKEEEIEIPTDVAAFLKAQPSLKKAYEDQVKGFNREYANKSIRTLINQN